MNKILILEPFNTSFHIDLAKSLSKNIYSFVFNYGNLIYLRGSNKLLVHKYISDASYSRIDLNLAKKTKSLYTETLRKIDRIEPSENDFIYMAKYISFLRAFINEKKITLLLMHNDLRWQHALAINVCEELGICYLITERGIFRPDTTTVEFKGVNANSSLTKEADFYRNLTQSDYSLNNYETSKFENVKVNFKFSLFLLLNKFGEILGMNSKLINKRYNFLNYVSIFLQQKQLFQKKSYIDLPQKYIFVPLQVNTDTQILLHSDYSNMQEFISHVETTFYSINSDLKLVFKIHPMEAMGNYTFDNRSVVINSDTKSLIKNSEFVVTVNSTVGFEAIQSYKKVIVLGRAFYKINDICICSSVKSFKSDLLKCLESNQTIDKALIDKFIFYLRSEYQVNGSLFKYDSDTLKRIKYLLEQQI